VDALGQRVRDRFNEEFTEEILSQKGGPGGLHSRTLKQLKAAKTGGPGSLAGSKSGDVFSQDKRYSLVKSSMKGRDGAMSTLEAKETLADKESVITRDRLQKFNEIQGTVAGTVEDEIQAMEAEDKVDDLERAIEAEEAELAAKEEGAAAEERDEVKSLAARSKVSQARSQMTGTSKTYISKLEQQLEAERQARLKLEKEVEEMKKINAEISSKLGLTNSSVAS